MKKFNHYLTVLVTVVIASFLFSCGEEKKEVTTEETTKPADSASTMLMAPTPAPAFKPFDIAEITHSVKDYDKWRPTFNNDSTERKASGMKDIVVGRATDNANKIFMAMEISDVKKAKEFAAAPRLKEVMDKAGVNSKPEVQFWHVIKFNAEANEKKWVMVTHKVKDFDAWVKAYDGEGTAKRTSEGMIDVLMARGLDDPNMVQVVFDITDLAKAKAAINSEEKKKLMKDAGVEGTPKIEFYSTAE